MPAPPAGPPPERATEPTFGCPGLAVACEPKPATIPPPAAITTAATAAAARPMGPSAGATGSTSWATVWTDWSELKECDPDAPAELSLAAERRQRRNAGIGNSAAIFSARLDGARTESSTPASHA